MNDTPVSLALQKQVGEMLVDLHGQHEHQSLLRTETHVLMLDEFGGLGVGLLVEERPAGAEGGERYSRQRLGVLLCATLDLGTRAGPAGGGADR